MPRSRCHFALLFALHERLRAEQPEAAALADRHLSDFVAGSVAPDGLRYVGKQGKRATHFYAEDRQETWGQAVAGMFCEHPDLADPGRLPEENLALVLGYISHLTVDEAFRDVVTSRVHGIADWRPVVQGLWSMVDELPIGYSDVPESIDRFSRQDRVGFIDCGMVGEFLTLIRPWADEEDPWELERIFLALIESETPLEEARQRWEVNRRRASVYMDEACRKQFVGEAVRMGAEETVRYLEGTYCNT